MNLPSGLSAVIVVLLVSVGAVPVRAQLVGHGGPVKTVAVSGDGQSVLSGSFDTSAILWSQQSESAQQVLRFHSDAVNAAAFLKDGRIVTAGAWHRRPGITLFASGRSSTGRRKFSKGMRRTSTALRTRRTGSVS